MKVNVYHVSDNPILIKWVSDLLSKLKLSTVFYILLFIIYFYYFLIILFIYLVSLTRIPNPILIRNIHIYTKQGSSNLFV